jgi:hypothetical protein
MPDSAKFKDETFIHRDNIEASRRLCPGFMRTTLTLDDDVAALLKRLRKTREGGLKELINEGLSEMTGPVNRRNGCGRELYPWEDYELPASAILEKHWLWLRAKTSSDSSQSLRSI